VKETWEWPLTMDLYAVLTLKGGTQRTLDVDFRRLLVILIEESDHASAIEFESLDRPL
jgi:hypothetical protein